MIICRNWKCGGKERGQADREKYTLIELHIRYLACER